MAKLVVMIMGQNCEKTIGMCLKSVKDADSIIYCDGGSTDKTKEIIMKAEGKINTIHNPYDQEDIKMNGKQRNFYLDYLKEHFMGDWVLCLDADEIVEDFSRLKEFVNNIQKPAEDMLCSIKMRHLIGDLGHEDSTQPIHFVPHRLFKVRSCLTYPEVEHPVLNYGPKTRSANLQCTTIWHLAYVPNMWEIKKRYENHLAKSQMHPKEYLKDWFFAHLFGTYPRKQFNPVELPKELLEEFGVDPDELYFNGRTKMEVKHYQDAIDWKEFFLPDDVIIWGCGFGQRMRVLRSLGVDAIGYEKSEYAARSSPKIFNRDITDPEDLGEADLVVAYDVLEHVPYEDLDKAINNLMGGKKILVSIPYRGTPNCDADPTHIIKEDRGWWVQKFTDKGLKEVEVPEHFLYRDQLLIFEK